LFYPLKEKGDGWWGLVSYQNELDKRETRIAELEAEVKEHKSRPTLESFVKLLLEATMNLFLVNREVADPIRQMLGVIGLKKEEAVLAAWILNKKDPLAEAIKELAKNPRVQVDVKPGATAQITEQGITNSYLRIPQ
jgi:pantoate kinase